MLSMCLWNSQELLLRVLLESFESLLMIGFLLALFGTVQFVSNGLVGARGGRYGTETFNGYPYSTI